MCLSSRKHQDMWDDSGGCLELNWCSWCPRSKENRLPDWERTKSSLWVAHLAMHGWGDSGGWVRGRGETPSIKVQIKSGMSVFPGGIVWSLIFSRSETPSEVRANLTVAQVLLCCYAAGISPYPIPSEIFSVLISVGIFAFCLVKTVCSIEPHINTGDTPTQAGIQHMPGSRWEMFLPETWANKMKLFNSQFRLFVIELDSSMERKTKPYFNKCHKTNEIPGAGTCGF